MTDKPECNEDEYAQARAERDGAVEERDFMLRLVQDLGVALSKGRLVRLHPTSDGVEVCTLYPTHAEALAVVTRIRDLIAMVCLAGDREALTAFAAYAAAIEAAQLRA
jgi:hypothetical protein